MYMAGTTTTTNSDTGGNNGSINNRTSAASWSLDLTIKVCGLSEKVTIMDLNTFFSYCGTVSHSQLINSHRKEDQQSSQFALVTFAQPYALKTALLLNDAIIVDSRICILPLRNSTSHDPNSDDYIMSYKSQQISLLGSKERDILWRSIKIQD